MDPTVLGETMQIVAQIRNRDLDFPFRQFRLQKPRLRSDEKGVDV